MAPSERNCSANNGRKKSSVFSWKKISKLPIPFQGFGFGFPWLSRKFFSGKKQETPQTTVNVDNAENNQPTLLNVEDNANAENPPNSLNVENGAGQATPQVSNQNVKKSRKPEVEAPRNVKLDNVPRKSLLAGRDEKVDSIEIVTESKEPESSDDSSEESPNKKAFYIKRTFAIKKELGANIGFANFRNENLKGRNSSLQASRVHRKKVLQNRDARRAEAANTNSRGYRRRFEQSCSRRYQQVTPPRRQPVERQACRPADCSVLIPRLEEAAVQRPRYERMQPNRVEDNSVVRNESHRAMAGVRANTRPVENVECENFSVIKSFRMRNNERAQRGGASEQRNLRQVEACRPSSFRARQRDAELCAKHCHTAQDNRTGTSCRTDNEIQTVPRAQPISIINSLRNETSYRQRKQVGYKNTFGANYDNVPSYSILKHFRQNRAASEMPRRLPDERRQALYEPRNLSRLGPSTRATGVNNPGIIESYLARKTVELGLDPREKYIEKFNLPAHSHFNTTGACEASAGVATFQTKKISESVSPKQNPTQNEVEVSEAVRESETKTEEGLDLKAAREIRQKRFKEILLNDDPYVSRSESNGLFPPDEQIYYKNADFGTKSSVFIEISQVSTHLMTLLGSFKTNSAEQIKRVEKLTAEKRCNFHKSCRPENTANIASQSERVPWAENSTVGERPFSIIANLHADFPHKPFRPETRTAHVTQPAAATGPLQYSIINDLRQKGCFRTKHASVRNFPSASTRRASALTRNELVFKRTELQYQRAAPQRRGSRFPQPRDNDNDNDSVPAPLENFNLRVPYYKPFNRSVHNRRLYRQELRRSKYLQGLNNNTTGTSVSPNSGSTGQVNKTLIRRGLKRFFYPL